MFITDLSKILNVSKELLDNLEAAMVKAGYSAVLEKVEKENAALVLRALRDLGLGPAASPVKLRKFNRVSAEDVRRGMRELVETHEKELYRYVGVSPASAGRSRYGGRRPDNFDFEKIAQAAREISTGSEGFFLKKDYAREILFKRPPEKTMKYLGYETVHEMLHKEDVGDVISALRFTESDAWMHETFKTAYGKFTPADFERRPIELRILGSQWKDIAEKYVAKKRHNVSHLKEFGIIFLNPVAQTAPGNFIRDFALLLHYFHEIVFYSKLFERHSRSADFNEKFISLLRGDVREIGGGESIDPTRGEWLIVQRYLWKENSQDPRLFLPRVNPEAMHWQRAARDLVEFSKKKDHITLGFWDDLDSAAGIFSSTSPSAAGLKPDQSSRDAGELVSFEIEDNAMTASDFHNGRPEAYFYHQREALWNKIFSEYVGGYDRMEEIILENMDRGIIRI